MISYLALSELLRRSRKRDASVHIYLTNELESSKLRENIYFRRADNQHSQSNAKTAKKQQKQKVKYSAHSKNVEHFKFQISAYGYVRSGSFFSTQTVAITNVLVGTPLLQHKHSRRLFVPFNAIPCSLELWHPPRLRELP